MSKSKRPQPRELTHEISTRSPARKGPRAGSSGRSCGRCDFCRKQMYSHCRHGGWILGNTIDGTQADYVRSPHADTSLYAIPADGDEEALVMLSDS